MKNSLRLNVPIRHSLSRAVLRHKFQKPVDELFNERIRIAEWAYNLKFDEATREKFASLPEGWLDEIDSMPFRAAGGSYSYRFDGFIYWHKVCYGVSRDCAEGKFDQRKKRAPHKYEQPHINEREFVLAVQRVEQRQEKLEEAMKAAHSTVHLMLTSYTTIGTLKKAWPEIEPFIPAEHEVKLEPVKLPAVRPATLNAMLDLPV